MISKEVMMRTPNLYQFASPHKTAKVGVCLATSPGKQPQQDKGCLPRVLCSQRPRLSCVLWT